MSDRFNETQNNTLELQRAAKRGPLIARSSAGNGAFAVLPKAKKRMWNAVKRVGSYSSKKAAIPGHFRPHGGLLHKN